MLGLLAPLINVGHHTTQETARCNHGYFDVWDTCLSDTSIRSSSKLEAVVLYFHLARADTWVKRLIESTDEAALTALNYCKAHVHMHTATNSCILTFLCAFPVLSSSVQKKSRVESEGEGSAVEIIENHPYKQDSGEQGQYTHKIYHIERHIPKWCRSLVPKDALEVGTPT